MTCRYCGTRNGDGEHRCGRCGRKPEDTLTGEFASPFMHGALATQLQPRVRVMEQAAASAQPTSRVAPNLSGAVQASLFQDRLASNVIAMPPREDVKLGARADAPAR